MKPMLLIAALLITATPVLAKDKPGKDGKTPDPVGQMLGQDPAHAGHHGGADKGKKDAADKGNKGGASDCAAAANNANLTAGQRADYMKNCVPK